MEDIGDEMCKEVKWCEYQDWLDADEIQWFDWSVREIVNVMGFFAYCALFW